MSDRHVDWIARKLRDLAARLDDVEAVAHSHRLKHVTTGAVAGTDWVVVSFDAYTSKTFMTFAIVVERATSSVVVPDTVNTGNISNVTVATLPVECRGTIDLAQPLSSGSTGRLAAGTYVASSGLVRLNAVNSSDDIIVGEQLSLGGVVILRP